MTYHVGTMIEIPRAALTADEIAKEANVTKKTIYTYFKDKDDLFSYFIQE